MTARLTPAHARCIALRAQGIGRARRDETPDRRASRDALRRTVERTHLLQIDSVSVFARAHVMPVFTRHGAWDVGALDAATAPGRSRLLTESLAHEAAFVPSEVHDLFAFRRARTARRDRGAVRRAAEAEPELLQDVLARIERLTPVSAAAVSRDRGDTERPEDAWGWRRTQTQWIVEYLFRAGMIDCVGRSPQFERLYAPRGRPPVTSAAVPGGTREPFGLADLEASYAEAEHAAPDAIRDLIRRAARACGVATEADLADYFRLPRRDTASAVAELRAAGELEDVLVRLPGGDLPMLRWHEAPGGSPLRVAALVSPFDPIAFHRPRLLELHGVDYRIGIYTPAARRTHGYYPLPFLLDDRIEARVDLRANRVCGVLEVREAHQEREPAPGTRRRTDPARVATALAEELHRARRWQGLEAIEVTDRGDLAPALARALA